jgi:CO/xanthine dehydrogenase FAD-binding subunit
VGTRIAHGAAAPTPIRATGVEEIIQGNSIPLEIAAEAANAAARRVKPLGMNPHKIDHTKALVQRAITA